MVFAIDKQIDCVRREIAMRKNVYPRLVAAGKKTPGSAEQDIACMTDALNTLILARNAHLDKSWNKPASVLDWRAYPENKPGENQKHQDFLVCYQNPHFIDKPGWQNRVSRWQYSILSWLGEDFMNLDGLKIAAFAEFAKFEE